MKQFTLFVPCPTRPTPLVQFEGTEFASLKEASESIIGQYGYKFALEIFGRAFVLNDDEAIRFSKHKLPFTLGIANTKTYSTMTLNEDGPTSGVHWVSDDAQ